MKARIVFVLTLFTLPFCSFTIVSKGTISSGNIHVVVHGIDKIEGQVGILLFGQKEGFPTDQSKALQQVLLKHNDSKITYTFAGLPYGTYAVAVMHDANMNDQLDTNFLGIPKEGTGVSNNAKGTFSAPKFSAASFTLDEPNITAKIELNY